MIGNKILKYGSRDPDHANKGVICHPNASTTYFTCKKFGESRLSRARDMIVGLTYVDPWNHVKI